MRLQNILRYCGISLIGVSILMFISALVALVSPGDASCLSLAISGTLTAVAGFFPLIFVPAVSGINAKEGFCVVAFSWIAVCIFGALPFLLYGGEFTVLNAFFESVSGFTTTGASILNDIESLPPGLQFWRIATSWIGGIGIVTLLSVVTPTRKDPHPVLATAETSNLARDYYTGRKQRFVEMMAAIYLIITIITFIALRLTGMGWLDALTHAMSACGTCGFSTKNASIAFFDNPVVELILMLAMLLGATNFGLIFATVSRSRKGVNIFRSEVMRVYFLLIFLAIISVTAGLLISGQSGSLSGALRVSSFQVFSLATNTGFSTADTNLWPPFCIVVLVICSLICGCSGSTSGGLKVDRVLLAGKAVVRRLRAIGRPSMVNTIKVNGAAKSEEEISEVILFIMLYFTCILIGGMVNTLGGLDLRTGLSASVACFSNTGPGFGMIGTAGNYAVMPALLKVWNMFLMLLGRLEIYPMFFLLSGAWRRKV